MKSIAILEYVSGGGFRSVPSHAIPKSLRQEGQAMLRGLAQDWSQLPDWKVHVAWDTRWGPSALSSVTVHPVEDEEGFLDRWRALTAEVDACLVIAPESERCLSHCLEGLKRDGLLQFNADLEFVEACSDKSETARFFAAAGVAHPATERLDRALASGWMETSPNPAWIIKPIDGAGCQSTYGFTSQRGVDCHVASLDPSTLDRYLLQPWLAGEAGSVVAIPGEHGLTVLPPMKQAIAVVPSHDKTFPDRWSLDYRGGEGPWDTIDAEQLRHDVESVLASLPGHPRGWIGIDFVWSEPPGGAPRWIAIEVNPRLTTSYLGLRGALGINLAGILVRSLEGKPPLDYGVPRKVRFDPFGVTAQDEVH